MPSHPGPGAPRSSPPRASRFVAAPAETVWAVLADGWQYATWVVGASRVRGSAGKPRHLVLTARAWPLGEARVELDVVPDGPATCTVSIAEDTERGPGRLVPPPLRQLLVLPRNREALRRLALLAEGRHRESPAQPS